MGAAPGEAHENNIGSLRRNPYEKANMSHQPIRSSKGGTANVASGADMLVNLARDLSQLSHSVSPIRDGNGVVIAYFSSSLSRARIRRCCVGSQEHCRGASNQR